jgi:PIN domain nuclease of toxin-antitoxin system
MTYVTDTHPLIWLLGDNPRLSHAAGDAFDDPHSQVIIPTIVLAEIKHLFARGRITVNLEAVLAYVAGGSNCSIYPLNDRVVARLPTTLDIHDAVIVGTALVHQDDMGESVALITRDAAITASGLVDIVW